MMRSAGRDRLPACVVRILSVLDFIPLPPDCGHRHLLPGISSVGEIGVRFDKLCGSAKPRFAHKSHRGRQAAWQPRAHKRHAAGRVL